MIRLSCQNAMPGYIGCKRIAQMSIRQTHMDASAKLLARLASEVCPKAAAAASSKGPPLDLRIGPSLPPQAAMAAARSFDDLDNVAATFDGFRVAHRTAMHGAAGDCAAAAATKSGRRVADRAVAAAGSGETSVVLRYPEGFSFAYCMLQVADASTPMLSAADSSRCVSAFVERASAVLERDRTTVAAEYRAAIGPRAPSATAAADSLRDPVDALSDARLNDAAVLSIGQLLRVVIVVRRPGRITTLPPTAAPNEAAVLVEWDSGSRRFAVASIAGAGTLRDVQAHLVSTDAGVRSAIELGAAALAKRPLAEVKELAERCACSCGRGRHTKAELAAAIVELGA